MIKMKTKKIHKQQTNISIAKKIIPVAAVDCTVCVCLTI